MNSRSFTGSITQGRECVCHHKYRHLEMNPLQDNKTNVAFGYLNPNLGPLMQVKNCIKFPLASFADVLVGSLFSHQRKGRKANKLKHLPRRLILHKRKLSLCCHPDLVLVLDVVITSKQSHTVLSSLLHSHY